jgi:hypothetical protein
VQAKHPRHRDASVEGKVFGISCTHTQYPLSTNLMTNVDKADFNNAKKTIFDSGINSRK